MIKILKKYNIELEKEEIKKFELFLELFKEKNSKINLSAIRETEAIIEKHFIDSIILNKYINLKWNITDMWTGWGFPLIPLAITNKNAIFTWIDSIWKKINAIKDFSKDLNLKNINTIKTRAEEIGQDKNYRESFDFVVSRATAWFPTLLEFVLPLLKVWWVFIAYKTDNIEEIESWEKALKILNAKIEKIEKYKIWDQDRLLVFIKKIDITNKKYPRENWIPLKSPII